MLDIYEKTETHLILLEIEARLFLELSQKIQSYLENENDLTMNQKFYWSETAFQLAKVSAELSKTGAILFEVESGFTPVFNESETLH